MYILFGFFGVRTEKVTVKYKSAKSEQDGLLYIQNTT